jgi:hypothetical protein
MLHNKRPRRPLLTARRSSLAAGALALTTLACSGVSGAINGVEVLGAEEYPATEVTAGDDARQAATVETLDYSNDDLWLCGSDGADDVCLSADLRATEVRADGTFEDVGSEPHRDPDFDCFYVYPNVDFERAPGNVTVSAVRYARSRVTPIVTRQGAMFRGVCRVFAPLYRQMTYGTYQSARESGHDYQSTPEFERAYGDVSAAFEHYLETDNPGRDIVLVGHGQGAQLLTRMLQERFDHDRHLRSRLISAVLAGPLGAVLVPEGRVVGGSFENLPLCEAEGQTGCVIAFDSQAATLDAERPEAVLFPEGHRRACTNPATLAGGATTLARAVWSTNDGQPLPAEVERLWAAYPDLYTARCTPDGGLGIDVARDDTRAPLVSPEELQGLFGLLSPGLALHPFDVTFAAGDLLAVVAAQGAAR